MGVEPDWRPPLHSSCTSSQIETWALRSLLLTPEQDSGSRLLYVKCISSQCCHLHVGPPVYSCHPCRSPGAIHMSPWRRDRAHIPAGSSCAPTGHHTTTTRPLRDSVSVSPPPWRWYQQQRCTNQRPTRGGVWSGM